MDGSMLPTLAVLALVDSTSFGTLLIPLWLMTSPRARPGRILLFVAVVASFYLAVGSALVLGGAAVVDEVGGTAMRAPSLLWPELLIGVVMLVVALRMGQGATRRIARWRDRATDGEGSAAGLATLALVAATLELATMLPYLAAVGLLVGSDTGWATRVGVLAAYCVVMTLPALLLLAVRAALGERAGRLLTRASASVERASGEATAWVLGIAGFLVARDALTRLVL